MVWTAAKKSRMSVATVALNAEGREKVIPPSGGFQLAHQVVLVVGIMIRVYQGRVSEIEKR